MKRFFKYSLPIGGIGTVIFLVLFVTNALYELLIPIVENSSLEGAAFEFWDNFIFYLPIIFVVLFVVYAIAGYLIVDKSDNQELAATISEVVDPMVKDAKDITKKSNWLSHDYHTVCPQCGARRKTDERKCEFCGHDLMINN